MAIGGDRRLIELWLMCTWGPIGHFGERLFGTSHLRARSWEKITNGMVYCSLLQGSIDVPPPSSTSYINTADEGTPPVHAPISTTSCEMGGPYTPDAQLIDDRMTAIFVLPPYWNRPWEDRTLD